MNYHYFPSCNFTSLRPGVSERIKSWLSSRGVKVEGCCRLTHGEVADGDTVLTICQACNIIIGENHPSCWLASVFEYVDVAKDFEFPDLGGEAVTIQDCYRARDHYSEKAAVRSLLKKMNARVVELPGLPEEVNFDGEFTLMPTRPANAALAPVRFAEIEKDLTPMEPEAREAYLKEYCKRFETERVVCYCNSCLTGLEKGLPEGKKAVHLAELLFAER